MIRDRLDALPAVIQLPIGAESEFLGVVDLLESKALVWGDGMGEEWEIQEIPVDMAADAEDARHQLIDVALQLRRHHHGEVPRRGADPAADLRRAVRTATLAAAVVPAVRSAFKNKGVQPMLDAVVDYLPSPLDLPPTQGTKPNHPEDVLERKADDGESFSALAFKIMTDQYVGRLTYLRVYSGTLRKGDSVVDSTKDKKERIGRILQITPIIRKDKEAVFAGNIVAVVGLKKTTTGDTSVSRGTPLSSRLSSSPSRSSTWPSSPRQRRTRTLSRALYSLSEEDPTFQVRSDEETGQTVISGMGELHLEVLVDRKLRELNVDANVGKPQVAYRRPFARRSRRSRRSTSPDRW